MDVVELLCSRLCHDLIGSIGALNNGLELLEEGDAELRGEALGLLARCGAEASARLQFFRAAYGRGVGLERMTNLGGVRNLAADYFKHGKLRLLWPESNVTTRRPVAKKSTKLLLNILLLGADALPLGGELLVRLGDGSDGSWVEVTASGERVKFADATRAALTASSESTPAADLEPATVQAYFAARLSASQGAGLTVEMEDGEGARLRITASLY